MPYRDFGAILRRNDDSAVIQNVTILHRLHALFSGPGKRRETQSNSYAEEDSLQGNLLPLVVISISMWAVAITGAMWLFHHLHF